MGFLSSIVGLDSIFEGIFDVFKRFVPDKDAQAKFRHEVEMYKLTSDFQNAMAQIEVNKEEAKSESLFVSGWRPYIGWICGVALTWHFAVLPMLLFVFNVFGKIVPVPEFDTMTLINILVAMLGLGGFRTYEKVKIAKINKGEQ